VVPIAPELRVILQDLFDAAEVGAGAVVPRLRDASTNLRTTFSKIIAKAGVKPWPRLFHNMRASCATDWVEHVPAHAVAGWLGHSPLIAAQHYLQTRDAHFHLVTGGGACERGAQSGAPKGQPVAQNAAQRPTAPARTESPDVLELPCFAGVSQAGANERNAAADSDSDPNGIRTRVLALKGRRPGPD
jgi:hypothetical protein